MPTAPTRLSVLRTRKQLLIAESDMNRAHLFHEWGQFRDGMSNLARGTRSAGSIASTIAMVFAGFKAIRGLWPAAGGTSKLGMIGRLMKVGSVAASLYYTFRKRNQKNSDEEDE